MKVYKRLNGKVVRVKLPKQDTRYENTKELEVEYPSDVHNTTDIAKSFKLQIRKVGV